MSPNSTTMALPVRLHVSPRVYTRRSAPVKVQIKWNEGKVKGCLQGKGEFDTDTVRFFSAFLVVFTLCHRCYVG